MRHSGLIITIFALILTPASFAKANDNTLCDYYDLYGQFIITFSRDTVLGNSGPSNVSGITFIFPDKSTLKIFPGCDTYNPPDIDPESESSRNDISFIQEHAHDGCNVTKTDNGKKIKITCKEYEYSIIEANNQKSHKVYIYVYYDFKSRKYDSLYHDIVNSLALIPDDSKDEFKFYHAAIQARGKYYFSQDATFRELIDSYQTPVIVCGNHRIRDKMLQRNE
jgi:hypothetical protein